MHPENPYERGFRKLLGKVCRSHVMSKISDLIATIIEKKVGGEETENDINLLDSYNKEFRDAQKRMGLDHMSIRALQWDNTTTNNVKSKNKKRGEEMDIVDKKNVEVTPAYTRANQVFLTPSFKLQNKEKREYILMHELAHVSHNDSVMGGLIGSFMKCSLFISTFVVTKRGLSRMLLRSGDRYKGFVRQKLAISAVSTGIGSVTCYVQRQTGLFDACMDKFFIPYIEDRADTYAFHALKCHKCIMDLVPYVGNRDCNYWNVQNVKKLASSMNPDTFCEKHKGSNGYFFTIGEK